MNFKQVALLITFVLITISLTSCTAGSQAASTNGDNTTPPTSPSPAVNDPGITYDGSKLTVKANVSSDLTSGSFGAAIRINDGVELFFYSAGTTTGEQTFEISKSELELELGQNINASDLKVRTGYSTHFPATTIVYTGGTATLKN